MSARLPDVECSRCGCHTYHEQLRHYPEYVFAALCAECFAELEAMDPIYTGKKSAIIQQELIYSSRPSMNKCALEHENLKAMLDDRSVYPEHGDNLFLRVSMLWDDWLIEFRKNRGIPLTPEEAREDQP